MNSKTRNTRAVSSWRLCPAYAAIAVCFVFVWHPLDAGRHHLRADDSPSSQAGALVLGRRIASFRVENAPIAQITYALNKLGNRVCTERLPLKPMEENYIDNDGHLVFTGPVYSLVAKDTSLRELLDRLVETAPEYQWQHVPGTDLINIFPKRDSRLLFPVPAFEASGRIDEIITRIPELKQLPAYIQRGPKLPEIRLTFAGGTGRDVLNEFVRLYPVPNTIWSATGRDTGKIIRGSAGLIADVGGLVFSSPSAEPKVIVDLVYDIKRGEPVLNPPDYQTVRYKSQLVTAGDASRLAVVRVRVDLVERETAALPEPNRTLIRQYVAVVRATLREDVAALTEAIHPDGVQDTNRKYSREEIRSLWKTTFEKKDYTKFQLRDVLDLEKIEVKAKGDGRFRVSTKPKIKYVGKDLYFDDELWFTFEKSEDGKWYIVELD